MSLETERGDAIRRFEAGDFAAAARLLVPLLARIRPDPMLLRLCGMSLLRIGDGGKGLPYLARARRVAPNDPVAALCHGIALHACGHFDEAARALQSAVALAPGDPAPLIHLTRALLKLSRTEPALAAARQAVDAAPTLPEASHALRMAELAALTTPASNGAAAGAGPLAQAWLALGLACLRLDQVADARIAIEAALAAEPLHASASAQLAVVEHLCGEPLRATLRLRALLARAPESAPENAMARLQLAALLLLGGEAEEALALLDGSAADPSLAQSWQAHRIDALIRLGRHEPAAAELDGFAGPVGDVEIMLCWHRLRLSRGSEAVADRMAQLASDRSAAPLEQRIAAHFDLAGLRQGQSRPEAAFAHWQRGHRLLRAAQPFSRARHAATVSSIMRAFDASRLRRGPIAANRDATPVFIVGLPRTGTTLAEHILAAHRSAHGAGERTALREALHALGGQGPLDQAALRAAKADQGQLDAMAGFYLSSLHRLAPGAARIVDKMPDNFLHLGLVATMLPGARVICCTRDLRDVGASIFQHGFLGHHPYAHDLADLGWYLTQHQRLLRHWRETLTIPMLELDHSEWLDDFDDTLRRVLDFLGLPYDPACARFFKQQRAVSTASREQVRQELNARGVGRWRAYEIQLAPMLRELASAGSSKGQGAALDPFKAKP